MSVSERFEAFKMRAHEIALEMKIEVEFTTCLEGVGRMSHNMPCIEVATTDTHEYVLVRGGLTFGESWKVPK